MISASEPAMKLVDKKKKRFHALNYIQLILNKNIVYFFGLQYATLLKQCTMLFTKLLLRNKPVTN